MKIFNSWQELADYIIESEKKNEIDKLKAEIDKLHHDVDFLQWMNNRRARTIKGYEEFTSRLIHELRKANKGCRRLRAKLNAAEEDNLFLLLERNAYGKK